MSQPQYFNIGTIYVINQKNNEYIRIKSCISLPKLHAIDIPVLALSFSAADCCITEREKEN